MGHWAVQGLICNKQAQHNLNFVPRQLLPQMQVLASSSEGQDNRGIDTSGVSTQTVAELCVGLQAPTLAATGNLLMGAETEKLRLQNKRWRQSLQDQQVPTSMWTTHTGTTTLPTIHDRPTNYRNKMCPAGIATLHPAGELLSEWSQLGCPTKTGRPWSKEKIWAAVERGPHQSSLTLEALVHFAEESIEKVKAGQAKLVLLDDIKGNPPSQMKVSPISAIPHKSKAF